MSLISKKPTTPGQRGAIFSNFDEITSKENKKSLMAPLKKHAGRNNKGKITVRHRGGGHKRKFRIIDFKRIKTGIEGIVESIQYDPNRSSNLALIPLSFLFITMEYKILNNISRLGEVEKSYSTSNIIFALSLLSDKINDCILSNGKTTVS